MKAFIRWFAVAATVVLSTGLAACSKDERTAKADAAIRALPVFAADQGLEVIDVALGVWSKDVFGNKNASGNTFTATFRTTADLVAVAGELGDRAVIRPVAKQGEKFEVTGDVFGEFDGKSWEVKAKPRKVKGAADDGEVKPGRHLLANLSKEMRASRPYVRSIMDGSVAGGDPIVRADTLKGALLVGSDQLKAAEAEFREAQAVAREAEMKAAQEKTAAEQRRQAEERAKQEAAQRAALMEPGLKVLSSPRGVAIVDARGMAFATIIQPLTVDRSTVKATGTAINLGSFPPKEQPVVIELDGSRTDRALWNVKVGSSWQASFEAVGDTAMKARNEVVLSTLSEAEMQAAEVRIETFKRAAAAAAVQLEVEKLDRAAWASRFTALQFEDIDADITYQDKPLDRDCRFIFSGSLGTAWCYFEGTCVMRFSAPKKASLLVLATNSRVPNAVVIINGVHRARVEQAPEFGAAIIKLPSDLEIHEVRLEVPNQVSLRAIRFAR